MKRFFWLPAVLAMMPIATQAETLLKMDFDTPNQRVWSQASGQIQSVGTIDVEGSVEPSKALVGNPSLSSGLLPVSTNETNLGKLTLSFSLSSSRVCPVTVRIESFNTKKKRTGGLVGQIYPAAPDFYQRYAVDLNTLKPVGAGKFQSTAPYVKFTVEGSDQLRLDNVNYATPAYYVSPNGSDKNDGRMEKTAFATPQKALDMAQPGDICVLMDGTYSAGQNSVASFRRGGAPDAWIVLKNYPNQRPMLTSTGWNIVNIKMGSKETPYDGPTLAYLEVRGLHIRGEGDVAKKKYPEAMNQADSRTNSNGIAIDGRAMAHVPHHIRMADNLVEYCPGCGLSGIETDWLTIENNVSRCNSWTTIYGTSGISTLGDSNFDATVNTYRMLIRNNVCYRNETFEFWKAVNRISDGNGIIIDVNQKTGTHPTGSFTGRTLVQSNLCFDNGGSGIHTVSANHVDIINNTAYLNSASKAQEYSEIFTYGSDDVRIVNNILVAPVANIAAGEKPEPVNRLGGKNTNVVFSHNLYFGGNIPPTLGDGDEIDDPKFVNPTRNGSVADFHLKPNSLAIGKGASFPFGSFLDLDGNPRKSPPSLGAYEK